jgi:hypothetical protein
LGRGGDVDGDESWADLAASSRDLFFPAPVFILFDGEDFILQVHRVFTRIRSGASLVASSGGARGFQTKARWQWNGWLLLARSVSNGFECGRWKTLRVSATIYNPTGDAATARWISIGN